MPDDFDPNLIADPILRQMVIFLMNQVEELGTKVKTQAQEIQRLKDENNRLKGEQARPKIKPDVKPKLISSEKERKSKKARRKGAKLPKLVVHRQEILRLDKTTLPPDAQFKGYKQVVVQDIVLTTSNVRFLKETYYSPSLKRLF